MPFETEEPPRCRVELTARVENPRTGQTHIVTLCLEMAAPGLLPADQEQRIREWTLCWSAALA